MTLAGTSNDGQEEEPNSRRQPLARALTGRELPLRNHAERALTTTSPASTAIGRRTLYDLVLREVEEPLFQAVLDYAEGNQSRAAVILGINRGTLRKKLKQFGMRAELEA